MAADRALVLFSGGQDSTVCLVWSCKRFSHVETIGFEYGQRHAIELKARTQILTKLRSIVPEAARLADDHVLALMSLAQISDTALTRETEIAYTSAGLPTTFVPGRNLLFLTYAAALGYRRGISRIVGGMCETDFSGYPDCRNATIQAVAKSVSLGLDRQVSIETPLMFADKAATWAMAHELGGDALVELIIEDTHTCYLGDRSKRHDWGYGCGTCPACELRANGFARWRAS